MNNIINDKCTKSTLELRVWLLRCVVGTLLILGYQGATWAASCSSTNNNYTLDFGNLIIQRDAQLNTYMTDYIRGNPGAVYRGCSGFSTTIANDLGVKVRGAVSAGSVDGRNVFQSELQGVGYILGTFASFQGTSGCSWGSYNATIRAGHTQIASCSISGNGFNANSSYVQPFFRLVNTGPLIGGQLSQIVGYFWGGSPQGYVQEVPIMATGTLTIAACSVVTPTVNVPLGSFFVNEFTAVGHTTTSQPVPVSLNCNAGARINATITADADTSQQGTFKLSADTGTATGVGVQILDKNGTPVKLNQKFVVDTATADGLYDFGWTARYIQTGNTVTTGLANASATMALTYE